MNNSSFSHWLKGCVYLIIPFLLVYLTVMVVCFGYFFFSPNIVGWSLHNTLDASNCIEVLKNAIAKYGAPEIINSDQGRQFTCLDWKEACREHPEMKISMDGRGRAKDNIWIERFWRTIKVLLFAEIFVYLPQENSFMNSIGSIFPFDKEIR